MIKKKLSLVPNKPGCYLMKNIDGNIIYVGKAKKLKNRLSSYFRGTHYGKTKKLVSEIVDFDYIIVNTETESLILELNLIKKYNPKYNILLKDDKSYPYIELTNEKVPRLLVVRNINQRKSNRNRMYGPYPNVTAARSTVNLLNRIYPLRKCKNYGKKECLYYHIGQCLGYCKNNVDVLKIKELESEIIRFLNGDHSAVTKKLNDEMLLESSRMNYEKAKELKDLLDYINITLLKERVELNDNIDRDIFGFYSNKSYLSIHIFFIRGGKILGKHNYITPLIDEVENELSRYILSFYQSDVIMPKEILIPDILDENTLSECLKISVKKPARGLKYDLIKMANLNAKNSLEEKFELIKRDEKRTIDANETLREILNLKKLDRIELFDNSNLFGTYAVSGMVVFKNGKPSKNDYRKFKMTIDTNDDYSMMKEVIYRRYFRVLKDKLERPDLIIVDGGLGQINVAREVIDSLNMNIPVVGLKKDNKHNTESLLANNPIEEIPIDKNSDLFHYLCTMQDEIHNFTINYHKQIRSKGAIESVLDNIAGIGDKRKKELLKKYRTIDKLKDASIDDLKHIIPENVAINLLNYLNNSD